MIFNTYPWGCQLLLSAVLLGLPAYSAAANPPPNEQSNTAVHQVTLDKGLYELVYSSRLNQVLVAVSGDRTQPEDHGYIAALTPDTLETQARYPTQARPFGLALDDEHGWLYTTNTIDATVSKYDIRHQGQHLSTLRLADKTPDMPRYPYRPREARIDTAQHRLYVTGLAEDGRLYVINTDTMALLHTVEHLGLRPSALAIDTAQHRLFVGNAAGEVIVLSTKTLKEEMRLPIGGLPLNMTYDAARQRLYAADYEQHTIKVIDARPNKPLTLSHHLTTADGPLSLAIDSTGHTLYVTERLNGSIAAFDLDRLTLLHRVLLPPFPNSLAIDSRSNAPLVTIKQERSKDKTQDQPEAVGRLP